MMLDIGTIIDDKYEIIAEVGQGGMSTVYLAMDVRLKKQWAVKVVPKIYKDEHDNEIIQKAMAEAELLKKLDHPAFPRVVDVFDMDDTICIVMDYVEGDSLDKILHKFGAQPQDIVVEWAKQLCEALSYLHSQNPPIIYRDLKPGNIILKSEGFIKVIDFGIAREYKNKGTKDTKPWGTEGYASPEQVGGTAQTDARSDIYSLGMTMYHLLTGHDPSEPPFQCPIRYWNPKLSGGLEAIIEKCTRKNPDERYQSAAELLLHLNEYEKVDIAFINKQRNRLKTFIVVCVICFLCFGVGIFGRVMANNAKQADYDMNISQALKTTNAVEKEEYYQNAISIDSTKLDAYLGLVQLYKEDAIFTKEEEEKFRKIIYLNLDELQLQEDYDKFAFEVGKLYWYYYDYNANVEVSDNSITRMKYAIEWFDDAVIYGGESFANYYMSFVYSEIGKFNRDIVLKIQEATDQGLYLNYFNNLKEIMTLTESNYENELVELELYQMIFNSIENYARKFKNDGITKNELIDFSNHVTTKIKKVYTTTDKTKTMKDMLLNKTTNLQNAIEIAYIVEMVEE